MLTGCPDQNPVYSICERKDDALRGSPKDWHRHIWTPAAAFTALCLLGGAAAAAHAAGGDSIATAPTLEFGALTTGGGKDTPEYWRIQAFAGDQMTVRSDNADSDRFIHGYSFEVYDPTVDDFRLSSVNPINGADNGLMDSGKQEFTIDLPFTGLGTIAICKHNSGNTNCAVGRNLPSLAYSYTATVAHLTSITLSGVPRRVRAKRSFKISARVQSPAGIPAGDCLIQPVTGRGVKARGPIPLVGGSCSATVKAGSGIHARYRVVFEGADGWRDASSTTRLVRVQGRRPQR